MKVLDQERSSDIELMLRLKNDDVGVFDVLYERYKRPLLNFIFRIVGQQEVAEEIFQEVFTQVFRRRKSYQPRAKFTTWLYKIAYNLSLKELRRRRRWGDKEVFSEEDEDGKRKEMEQIRDEGKNPEEIFTRAREVELVKSALQKLPEIHRKIVILREYQNLSYSEIAELLGIAEGTVKSRLFRARLTLKELLKDLEYGEG